MSKVILRETSRDVYNGFQGDKPVAELTDLQGYLGAMVKARALYPEQGVIEVQHLTEPPKGVGPPAKDDTSMLGESTGEDCVTLKVSNTRENWDLLITAHFWSESETQEVMTLGFQTNDDREHAMRLLEMSSNAYPRT